MNQKVLVTGVAGFVGSNLADRLLSSGYDVIGIDNLAYGLLKQIPAGVDFHAVDIRSRDIQKLFCGVDVVFHLAAKNDLIACQQDPVETMQVNVAGTASVFEAARRAGARKVVFATSSALEEGEARLNGFYAISKVANERIAAGYQHAFGLPFVALRYFNVYGPRQDYRRVHPPVISAFILKVLAGEAPALFDGYQNNKRDFIYVDDINDFHLQCITDDRLNGNLYRLGSGQSLSMDEVWRTVKTVTGCELDPVVLPREAEDTPTIGLADISAAAAVGWRPKTSFIDGVRAQFEYLTREFETGNVRIGTK
jgi:UDP-glucose 4-epimerase